MIDISQYEQRLQWLKEWIADRIDGKILPPMWVNIDALPFNFTIEQVMRIFDQCGIWLTTKQVAEHPMMAFSFEEYCKYKQDQLLTSKQ